MAQAAVIALGAMQAMSQIRQGQAQEASLIGQAQGLEVQAEFTRFSAKQESLKHKAQAVQELEKTLVRQAQINAAAGAGNIDPNSGNPFGLTNRALDVGGTNYAMADNNRAITVLVGEQQAQMQLYQAQRARAAGKAARKGAMMSAMFTMATSAFSAYTMGGAPSGGNPQGGMPSGGGNILGGFSPSNSYYPGGSAGSYQPFAI